MLKIGEFSKIAQVSVKTLHHYDRMGLLKPAHIDRFTGYRYYTFSQLVRLNRILALKDLDFSLDQVKELLMLEMPENTLQRLLENKALELRGRIGDEQARLLRVENHLKNIADVTNSDRNPVLLKSAPDYLVATVRAVLPRVSDLKCWQASQLKDIHHYLEQLDQNPTGPDLLIHHHDEFREEDLDIEVGTIIRKARHVSEKSKGTESIRIHALTGVNQLATIITTKVTGTLSETYTNLTQWTQANGFRPTGAWRELTYRQDGSQEVGVIEVQRPVMKAIEFYKQLEANEMEPKIKTKPAFTIAGLRYFGKNQHGEIPKLWETLNHRMKELGDLPHNTQEAAIGLCITPDDEPTEGDFEYVAGFPVSEVGNVPEDFVVRHVPEQTYAVFEHKGDLSSLSETYGYIYETWLPQSGYELSSKMDFEYYNEDFNDFEPNSIFYIYLPIKKA